MASSSGTVTFYGGNNITLKTGASSIEISGAGTHAQQTAISGIGNSETTYTSGTVSLSGGNNITIQSGTGQRFIFSGPNSHAQQTGISGIANSETTYTSGTVSLSVVAGNLTIRSTTGQAYQFSMSQSVQAETQTFVGGIAASNTTYTSGTVTITGVGGGITVSSNTGQRIDLSVAAQTNQTGGIYVTAQSTGQSSSSTHDMRTLSIVADGILSAGWSNSSFRISAPAQTALTATTVSSVSSANAVGANNSRFALEAHIHEGVRRVGISTQGNTSGSTGVMPGSNIVFVGGNNITLSGSTDAQSNNTITISAPNLGAGAFSGGVSNLGNTAGSTGVTGTRYVLVGTNNITLSQSTDANGGTVSISGAGGGGADPTLSMWDNLVPGTTLTSQHSDAQLMVVPLQHQMDPFHGNMTVSTMMFDVTGTVSTAAAFTRSMSVGFYTMVNSTQLSLAFSASTSWGTNAANMNINDSVGGYRWVSFLSSQFNNSPNFSQTHYWMGVWQRSSSGSQTFSYFGQGNLGGSVTRSGQMMSGSTTATSWGWLPFRGGYSVSFSTALPNALAASDMNLVTAGAHFVPHVHFNNLQSVVV